MVLCGIVEACASRIIDRISHPDIKFPWYTWQEKRRFCCVFSQKEAPFTTNLSPVYSKRKKTLIIKDKISRIGHKSVFDGGD